MYSNDISTERALENTVFSRNALPKTPPLNVWLTARRRQVFFNIAPFLEKVVFAAGTYIHQPEEQADYIYFPETAVVSEFQILKDGRAVGLSLHASESILGLMSAFDTRPADTWIQVLLPGNAYRTKTEIFKAKLLQHQPLQTLIFEYTNSQIKQLAQRVVCNSYHTLEERFCSFLLRLQDCRRNHGFPITQEQIAYFLGTHRPSVTQIAQLLRAKKIISYVRKNLTVLERESLVERACECYTKTVS